ncbi:MAG: radical SAM protein [Candidatus Zixiibacteriota bacterium]|nr:MAG: radical SAM protein [candidate division Zixibacteria bacterium]
MQSEAKCDINRVVVELVAACNNSCAHCYNYWQHNSDKANQPRRLERCEVRDLVSKVRDDAPLSTVAISGGEPFLHEELPEIVCDLADDGLNAVVITNGTLLGEARLKRFPTGTAFEVTLFSADADLHNRLAGRVVFDSILDGLVRLERHGGRFVLALVVTRLNAHDVSRTIELGLALGAEGIMLNRVNLSRRCLPLADQIVPDATMLQASLDAAEKTAEKYDISVAVSVPIPPCLVDPQRYRKLSFGWCPRGGSESYYTIGWNSLVRPCNHSSVVLGDLCRETFADIVNSARTTDFWAPEPKECRRCRHPMAKLCRGGCPAAADECYGTRERIDPFVAICGASPPSDSSVSG